MTNRPLCTRCENDDRDGALRARGDMLLCVGCYEAHLEECDECGVEVPEYLLRDSKLVGFDRICPKCFAEEKELGAVE